MNTRYQVLWDNRPSKIGRKSKAAAAKAPKHDPVLPGIPEDQIHSSENGLHGYVNFEANDYDLVCDTAESLKEQGYLAVSIWDTLRNPLSSFFKF